MYFHGGLLFFAESDFAETTLLHYFFEVQQLCETVVVWKLLIHIMKQENVRHPSLCSRITENTVENSGITVILSKKQWYNTVIPRDHGLHHCL